MSEKHKLCLVLALKIGILVQFHRENINLGFGIMKNNWAHLVSDQSGLLGFAELGTLAKKQFLQTEWTWESV